MSKLKCVLLSAVLSLVLGTASLFTSIILSKPALYPPLLQQSQAVYARDGELLRLKLASDQRYRLYSAESAIPQSLIDATLLYEDRWYYQHNGVNPAAIWRAVKSSYLGGERRMGASTITMQAARMRFKLHSASVLGKLRQIWHAWQLEWHYSKAEILTLYFNLAPYGGNVESAAAASLVWLNKPLKDITVGEALSLSVIPQNPSKRYPGSPLGQSAVNEARERLLAIWLERYPQDVSKRARLELAPTFRARRQLPYHAPHFVQQLPKIQGELYSTLSLAKQLLLESRLHNYVARHKSQGLRNAAALLLNSETMQIEALVGSADFNDADIHGQVDGTIAQRSPGSTLKPFVYALAMDAGLIHPRSILEDAPKRYGAYTPENFDKQFSGPVSAEKALIYSRNLPAVNLLAELQKLPNYDLYKLLQDAQIANLKPKLFYGLALTLGGNEVSMVELAQLYAMLANDGRWQAVKRIKSAPAAVSSPQHGGKQLLSAEASWLVRHLLAKNTAPNKLSLAGQTNTNNVVSWKTGTSWAYRDAWSVGIFGRYVLVIWAGNFNGEGNPFLIGRHAAAPLFFDIANTLMADEKNGHFQPLGEPDARLNIRQVPICEASGDLPNPACPSIQKTWFIPGVSPIKMSTIHRQIPLFVAATGEKSGMRSCLHNPPDTQLVTYEFWPSHIQTLYRTAGLARKTPPPYAEPCEGELRSDSSPTIISPDPSLSYALTSHNKTIPLIANAAADANTLYWFVSGKFVGQSAPSRSLLWRGQAGVYEVAVSDQLGRSDTVQLRVTRSP